MRETLRLFVIFDHFMIPDLIETFLWMFESYEPGRRHDVRKSLSILSFIIYSSVLFSTVGKLRISSVTSIFVRPTKPNRALSKHVQNIFGNTTSSASTSVTSGKIERCRTSSERIRLIWRVEHRRNMRRMFSKI